MAAFVAVAAAIAATALHIAHDGTRLADHTSAAAASPKDPLARELARCRVIGMAAKDEAACAAAWAETRRRFFIYAPSPDDRPLARANGAGGSELRPEAR